jgi:hypothetical protein
MFMRSEICAMVSVSVFCPDHSFKSALQTAGVGFTSGDTAIAGAATVRTKNMNESVFMPIFVTETLETTVRLNPPAMVVLSHVDCCRYL